MSTFVRPTIQERLAIARLLEQVCQLVDGRAAYKDGWTDRRVGAEAAPRVSIHVVGNMRRELIGNINVRRLDEQVTLGGLSKDVGWLQDQIEKLQERADKVDGNMRAIVRELSASSKEFDKFRSELNELIAVSIEFQKLKEEFDALRHELRRERVA